MQEQVSLTNVAKFLEQRGWKVGDLAREMKLSYSYVYRVMRRQRPPGKKFITALVLAGMPPADLLAGDDDSILTT